MCHVYWLKIFYLRTQQKNYKIGFSLALVTSCSLVVSHLKVCRTSQGPENGPPLADSGGIKEGGFPPYKSDPKKC